MARRAAVFCHNGLGDAIISLVLSHNLHQNGWKVDSYHNGMDQMQSWFPHLPLIPYPQIDKIPQILKDYDLLIIFQNDTFDFVLELIRQGKLSVPEKVKVIYPYPTKGIISKPYYRDSLFDVTKPIVRNLHNFCSKLLHLPKTTLKNGIIAPQNLIYRKDRKRVVLHVASSRKGKNWPIQKFVELAKRIKKKGYKPVIIAGSEKDREAYLWLEKEGWDLPLFESITDVASYLYESGYLVGNDSGLGHLANSMGVPTVTISRRKRVAQFWRPIWSAGRLAVPSSLVPNISGFRLRDRKWQKFISVNKVLSRFQSLVKETKD